MKKNRMVLLILACILSISTSFNILAATTPQTTQKASIHYISTGNSDSILISDNGHYAMIDGADNDDEQFLVDYLNNSISNS